MAHSMSLHIGVNEVDSATYGTVPRLRSAVKDAEAMEAIATDLEYQDRIILRDGEATAASVLSRIGVMAQQVEPGGVALVTYAGHGSEVPDDTGDEPSGRDQTWVLYDRMLIDDELRSMWSRFAPGVRIFFVSDSCHSGSVARFTDITKELKYNKPQFLGGGRDIVAGDTPIPRVLPPDAALKAFVKYEDLIVSTQWTCGNRDFGDMKATVISLTACQDDEVAGDGANNGLFTAALLQTWNNGQFSGNSDQFLQAIARKTRMYQRPRYDFFGAQNPAMLGQKPFMPELNSITRDMGGFRSAGRAQRAKDLLAANGVYPQGCSAFVADVLQIPWENANSLMGSSPTSVGTFPNYTGLSAGDIVGWKSTTGSGHVAVYIGEAGVKFIDVREPGSNSRPRSLANGYGTTQELFKSSRF